MMAYIKKEPLCTWLSNMGVSDYIIKTIESEEHFPSCMSEWIHVNERLPETNERVLVYLKEKVSRYTQIDTDRVIAKKAGWVRWGDEVTHWMPLPEPPKPQ